MRTIILLFCEFFKTGLFSFGGGYATLPFLYEIGAKYNWYTSKQLSDILAVSSLTPGPVGINMATFSGFVTEGISGSLIATLAVILPSLIIVSLVFDVIEKFKKNKYILGVLNAIKPIGCALLTSVGIKLVFTSNLHLFGTIFLISLIISTYLKKLDTVFYLGIGAIFGYSLGLFNLIGV